MRFVRIRRVGLFAVLAVVAGFTGLVVHEVLGHLFPAWLFGAKDFHLVLNPDFTGSAGYSAPGGMARWQAIVVDSGGIAVNLLTGLAALLLRPRHAMLRLFLVLFGGISVYKALEYTTMSLFYGGSHDPLQHANPCTIWHATGYWLAPLLALPFAAFVFARAYVEAHAEACPELPSPKAALLIAAPTLSLGGAFYYRASLFGGFAKGVSRLNAGLAAHCHVDPTAVRVPFPMLPLIVMVVAAGGLCGAGMLAYVETRIRNRPTAS